MNIGKDWPYSVDNAYVPLINFPVLMGPFHDHNVATLKLWHLVLQSISTILSQLLPRLTPTSTLRPLGQMSLTMTSLGRSISPAMIGMASSRSESGISHMRAS